MLFFLKLIFNPAENCFRRLLVFPFVFNFDRNFHDNFTLNRNRSNKLLYVIGVLFNSLKSSEIYVFDCSFDFAFYQHGRFALELEKLIGKKNLIKSSLYEFY